MSDIAATADYSAAEDTAPASEGLVETSTPTEYEAHGSETLVQESAPVEPLFEVDGTPITLDEARNGYLRQADYTRKTQELAEMRSRLNQAEALAAALERDPTSTLRALQDAFGVQTPQAFQEPTDPYSAYEEVDPEVARIAAIEARLEAQDAAARQAQIERDLGNLHERFGDFDEAELFAHAIRGNFPNLQSAYADLNFQNVHQQLSEIQRQRMEEEQRREAARNAGGVVHDGGLRAGATVPAQPSQYGSLRDAYLAAKRSLGAD